MKRHLPGILCATPFLLFASCAEHSVKGHGPSATELRQLPGASFDKVEISAPVDARITVGGASSLNFDGYTNIIQLLRTEIKDGTLRIYVDKNTDISTNKNIVATISLPTLAGLDLSGSSNVTVAGEVNAPKFNLDISGAGNVDIQELHVQSFESDMSGATSLVMQRGEIGAGAYDISGSGEIKAFGVSQQSASLDLSGSAEAEVTVASKLDVKISGSGTVLYKGHPSVSQQIGGVGSVKDAN